MNEQTPDQARGATVRHLREAALARVENSTLRGVAREIGMSPMGLRNFLRGTDPYAPTLRRLRNWYVRHGAGRSGTVGTEDANAALAVLVHDLAPAPRRQAAVNVLDALGRGYEQSGVARPPWVGELRTRYES